MRVLYSEVGHAHDEYGHTSSTQPLRIAAIFIIMCAGLLGGIPPLFLKAFGDQTSLPSILARAFSSGVILALACVHISPDAILELNAISKKPDVHASALSASEHDEEGHIDAARRRLLGAGHGDTFPYGGVCILGGILIMILFEHIAHAFYGGHSHGTQPHDAQEASSADGVYEHDHQRKSQIHAHFEVARDGVSADHAHECVSRGIAANWLVASEAARTSSVRAQILAVLFEFGCIFHSVIIGLALGVNETDLDALLIALVFHQWLEGVSLASVVSLADFSLWKRISMIVVYSMTCPVGVAIGIGISQTYDSTSERARGVQGSFNGVSGGMLLYISLVQLIAEDMSRAFQGQSGRRTRLLSYLFLLLGGGLMCMLAIWA